MNKKSFIRGFGIGVIFTALILGTSCIIRTSNSEIISRAKKLGMVFEDNEDKVDLSSPSPESTSAADDNEIDKPADDNTALKSEKPNSDKTNNKTDKTENTDKTEKNDKPDKNNKTDEATSKKDQENYDKKKEELENNVKKELVINDGDWSEIICKRLEDMGIIDSANEFDNYLVAKGYGNKINSGTYEISPDDTYEEIAQKITSRFKN